MIKTMLPVVRYLWLRLREPVIALVGLGLCLLVLSWFIDIEQMLRCILSGGGDCLPRGMGDEA